MADERYAPSTSFTEEQLLQVLKFQLYKSDPNWTGKPQMSDAQFRNTIEGASEFNTENGSALSSVIPDNKMGKVVARFQQSVGMLGSDQTGIMDEKTTQAYNAIKKEYDAGGMSDPAQSDAVKQYIRKYSTGGLERTRPDLPDWMIRDQHRHNTDMLKSFQALVNNGHTVVSEGHSNLVKWGPIELGGHDDKVYANGWKPLEITGDITDGSVNAQRTLEYITAAEKGFNLQEQAAKPDIYNAVPVPGDKDIVTAPAPWSDQGIVNTVKNGVLAGGHGLVSGAQAAAASAGARISTATAGTPFSGAVKTVQDVASNALGAVTAPFQRAAAAAAASATSSAPPQASADCGEDMRAGIMKELNDNLKLGAARWDIGEVNLDKFILAENPTGKLTEDKLRAAMAAFHQQGVEVSSTAPSSGQANAVAGQWDRVR